MAAIAVLVPCVATAAHADARPAQSVPHTSTGDPNRIYDATPLPHPSPPGTAGADSSNALGERSAPPPGVSLEATPQVGATGTAAITSHWIENGYTGAGVKIGVIDWFDAAAVDAAVLSGDLPSLPASKRRCFVGPNQCTFGTPGVFHGNYEANAVFDEAPGAEIYLVEVLDIGGMYTAIDWLASNGVTIVSHTLLTAFDGPGNGTGPAAAAVDYAVYKGIAWFQYGGNFGKDSQYTWYPGSYWRGAWSDPDNDRWLNFTGTDETLGTFCGALMGLRWSDWGAARTDYELWAADVKIATGTVSTAIRITDFNQAAGAAPLEGNDLRWLCNSNPAMGPVYDTNQDGYIALKVKRSLRSTAASATGDIMELEVLNGYFEYAVDANSIAVPFADSKNLGEATVIGQTSRGGSHGPTNDGRVKPDLSTKTSPSASPTAQAAGAAAVVRSALGEMKPWQLVQYFRNYTTIVAGTEYHPTTEPTVPSNNVGYGYVSLRGNGPPRTPLAPSKILASSFRLFDSRIATGKRTSTAPLPPNSAYSIEFGDQVGLGPNGGYPQTLLLNITITNSTGPGYVQVSPGGWSIPGSTSVLNVERAGQTVANIVEVPVGALGEVTIYTSGGGHIIVDQLGKSTSYHANEFDPVNGYVALNPFRAYDSRCATCGVLTGGTYRDIKVTGVGTASDPMGSVPDLKNVLAVAISVTADSPSGNGFISAVPTTVSPPMPTSTANYQDGRSITGMSLVPVDASGNIRIYSLKNTHFQVDILGFTAINAVGGLFSPVTPFRAVDTRAVNGGVRPAAGADIAVTVATNGVPANAGAVFGNLTTTSADAPGSLRIGGSAAATAGDYRNSTVSAAGQVIAAGVLSATENGDVHVVATSSAHRILDITGWFGPITRAIPGTVSAAPFESLQFNGGTPVISPNGMFIAWASSTHLGDFVYDRRVMVWNRATGTVSEVDVTSGPGRPNGTLAALAISDDGTRLAFKGEATNIVPEDTDYITDHFVADFTLGTISLAGLGPNGQRVTPHFDGNVTKMAWDTTTSYFPEDGDYYSDVYEKDLSSGVTTLLVDLGTSNTTGYGLDLNSIYYTGHVWRRGQATVDLTLGTLYRLSHDGRYAIDVVGANVVLHDLDTGTNTVVCSATSGTPDLPIIDWTGGPPPAGTWCVGADKQRYVDSTGAVWHPTYGQHGIVTSGHDGWYSGIGVYTPRGGVVPLSAPIRHDLLAGNFPESWIYLFDPTP